MTLFFYAVTFGGMGLALVLLRRAVAADTRYLRRVEIPTETPASVEPAWVQPEAA